MAASVNQVVLCVCFIDLHRLRPCSPQSTVEVHALRCARSGQFCSTNCQQMSLPYEVLLLRVAFASTAAPRTYIRQHHQVRLQCAGTFVLVSLLVLSLSLGFCTVIFDSFQGTKNLQQLWAEILHNRTHANYSYIAAGDKQTATSDTEIKP